MYAEKYASTTWTLCNLCVHVYCMISVYVCNCLCSSHMLQKNSFCYVLELSINQLIWKMSQLFSRVKLFIIIGMAGPIE